ncbi:MAG: AhpC/TSA family protein [Flavobacteriales bacterium]|nr:AhpC/TSA family protein [Flavobacteriales bacterium]
MKMIHLRTLPVACVAAAFQILTAQTVMAQEYRTAEEVKGIEVGERVAGLQGVLADGSEYDLDKELKKGKTVVIFYRGQWCPVCSRHLSNVQDSLQVLKDAGINVVAVSPEKPEKLTRTQEKTKAAFTLVHDRNYAFAKAFDVLFRPDQKTLGVYNTMLGADLKNAHSDDSQQLPVPATFLIDTDGKVLSKHVDPNYKNRASVAAIIAASKN